MGIANQKSTGSDKAMTNKTAKSEDAKTPLLAKEAASKTSATKSQANNSSITSATWDKRRTGVYKFDFSTTRHLAGSRFGIVFLLIVIFLAIAAFPTTMMVMYMDEAAKDKKQTNL